MNRIFSRGLTTFELVMLIAVIIACVNVDARAATSVPYIFPGGLDGSTRWGQVNEDFSALGLAIDTISLTPGPQGPQGPAGPQGPQGPAGPAGGGSITIGALNGTDCTDSYGLSAKLVVSVNPDGSYTITCNGAKTVFITSDTFNGNLGGLAGADQLCQARAVQAGLLGNFKAWLSDDMQSPQTRFTHPNLPYVLVNKTTVIAVSWTALVGGVNLLNPISLDQYGNDIGSGYTFVWTDTIPYGTQTHIGWDNCNQWTDSSVTAGAVGIAIAGLTYAPWTQGGDMPCSSLAHLYCFQQ